MKRDRLTLLLVIVAALLPRVLDLGGFVIEDEARFWLVRSRLFLQALTTGDFGATAISTHPGVTTMWLGALGILARRTAFAAGLLHDDSFPVMLAWMRMPVVLVHTAGVVAGWWLLRRLVPPGLALLAALLWALDPFVTGFDRVLHVDGLMGTFATLSLLLASQPGGGRRWALLAGASAALAVLSKSTGVAVLPVVALALGWGVGTWRERVAAWGWCALGGVGMMLLAWPAVWAAPLKVWELLTVGVEVEGSAPHQQGNFFLGQRDDTPGPLFYLVAVALRTTPVTLVGLGLLGMVPLVWGGRGKGPLTGAQWRLVGVLALFVVVMVAGLTPFEKKLNRYVVPAFPAVGVLAGMGWWGVAGRWARWRGVVLGSVGAVAVGNAVWWHPYGIVAYNQLLGGAPMGARTFLMGNGEGLEQAAAWLNTQPDITGVTVATIMTAPLQPYLRKGAQAAPPQGDALPDHAGYAVVYVRHTWNGAAAPFDQFYGKATPLTVIQIHGVDYVWIYQVPPPVAHPVAVSWENGLRLQGYDVTWGTDVLSLTTQWQGDAPLLDSEPLLFVHVYDAAGTKMTQVDVPPAGPTDHVRQWQPGRVYTWTHPVPLPATARGQLWVVLGVYDPATGVRVPLRQTTSDLPPFDVGGATWNVEVERP